jgi:hypothetical protein
LGAIAIKANWLLLWNLRGSPKSCAGSRNAICGKPPNGKCATYESPNHMNDQQSQYDCSKVCFYVGPTNTGPRVSFPQVPLAPTFRRRVPLSDCVIYRDKPLPREAFWRTAEQGPPVWLPLFGRKTRWFGSIDGIASRSLERWSLTALTVAGESLTLRIQTKLQVAPVVPNRDR